MVSKDQINRTDLLHVNVIWWNADHKEQIRIKAQHQWLYPFAIYEILQNYNKLGFGITPQPAQMPPSTTPSCIVFFFFLNFSKLSIYLYKHIITRHVFPISGGSLFLFDRKAQRHFINDGHNWRKRNDGKTLKEGRVSHKVSIGHDAWLKTFKSCSCVLSVH
jgi:hypothetical protein